MRLRDAHQRSAEDQKGAHQEQAQCGNTGPERGVRSQGHRCRVERCHRATAAASRPYVRSARHLRCRIRGFAKSLRLCALSNFQCLGYLPVRMRIRSTVRIIANQRHASAQSLCSWETRSLDLCRIYRRLPWIMPFRVAGKPAAPSRQSVSDYCSPPASAAISMMPCY